ncbi:chemotaxis protein CheW [Ferrovibrio xuzhouensis]|uniref:Chemotaxis protein CheW n=1 Tax=Ferrovibrio xuzhouensis TaxID=1576914 RepID=A0ABV7VD57_9PROT
MASRIDQGVGSQRAGGTLEDGLVAGAELDTLLRRRASELVASQNRSRQRNLIPEQLSARIGEESYGLPLTSVTRIVPYTGCAAAPGGRWPLLGIIGSQGDSWALYDLGGLLGGSIAAGGAASGYAVLLRHDRRRIALRVDAVAAAGRIDRAEIRTIEALSDRGERLLYGVATKAGLQLIDINALWMLEPFSAGGKK